MSPEDLLVAIYDQLSQRKQRYAKIVKAGETTRFFESLLDATAQKLGYEQIPEVLRIDFSWYDSPVLQHYKSGSSPACIPATLPDVLIEHENYGGGNPGAALIRLLSARGKRRLLIAWTDDVKATIERLKEARKKALNGGLLESGSDAWVLVLTGKNVEEDPAQGIVPWLLTATKCDRMTWPP